MRVNRSLSLAVFSLIVLSGCGSAPQQPVAVAEGERLLSHGVIAYGNDDLLAAANFFTKALSHYQGLDDAEGQLRSRINLIEVALAVGNLEAAQRHLTQAQALAVGTLSSYQPRLLLLSSSLALARGDMATARRQSEALLPEKLGGTAKKAAEGALLREALINRTRIALNNNDESLGPWIERLEKHSDGDPDTSAWLNRFKASQDERRGDHDAASLHIQQALELCKGIPSRRCIAGALEQWGGQLQDNGDLAGAEDRYQRALAVRLALLDRGGSGSILRHLSEISQATGRSERAKALSGLADRVASGDALDWEHLRTETLPR